VAAVGMIVLAHITAVGSAAFIVPLVIVMLVLAQRGQDQSDRAVARRRRAIARRATVREYWTLERRGERWVVVETRQDDAPDLPVAAPTPWAAVPATNGHGHPSPEAAAELIAAIGRSQRG
jgi:hypothetical protein